MAGVRPADPQDALARPLATDGPRGPQDARDDRDAEALSPHATGTSSVGLARRVHFLTGVGLVGFALMMGSFETPQVAIDSFDGGACVADPKGQACQRAQSQASLAISVSSGVSSFVCLLGGPSLGVLSDARGRRFYTVGSVATVLVAMLALLAHVFGLVTLWFYLGLNVFSALILPALFSVVADEHAPRERATAFARVMAVFDGVILLAPVMGKLAIRPGTAVIAGIAALGLLCFAVYPESLPRSKRIPVNRARGAPAEWRPDVALSILNSTPLFRRLALVIVFSTLPMAGSQQCLVLFLISAYQMSRVASGAIISALGASGLATQLILLPCLQRRYSSAQVLVLGLAMQLVAEALKIVPSVYAVWASAVLGGAASMVFPCVAALKANAGSASEQGKIQGAVSCLQSCCRGVGPLVYGPILAWLVQRGQPQLLWCLSVLMILPALAAAVALQRLVDDDAGCHAVPEFRRTVSLWRGTSSSSLGAGGLVGGGASPAAAAEASAAPAKSPLPDVKPRSPVAA